MVYKPYLKILKGKLRWQKNILEAKIGFGTWQALDPKLIIDQLRWAIENNYDFIDTAWVYQNEKIIGDALSTLRNQNYKIPPIQTKIWTPFFKQDVIQQLKSQLKDLQLECVDSVLLHRPHVDNTYNVKAWKELIQAKKLGLVKHIGVSNFDKDMIEILYTETGVYPEINQIELSANYTRRDRIKYNLEKKIVIQAWTPLGLIKENLKNSFLIEMAKKYNCTVPQLLIAYASSFKTAPIIKSSSEERVKENIAKINLVLDEEDIYLIDRKLNRHESSLDQKTDTYPEFCLDK